MLYRYLQIFVVKDDNIGSLNDEMTILADILML
jgi:hypothetical protein